MTFLIIKSRHIKFQASRESLKYTVFTSVSIECGQKSITGIILRTDHNTDLIKGG